MTHTFLFDLTNDLMEEKSINNITINKILLLYNNNITQKYSLFPCVCLVADQRRRQNVAQVIDQLQKFEQVRKISVFQWTLYFQMFLKLTRISLNKIADVAQNFCSRKKCNVRSVCTYNEKGSSHQYGFVLDIQIQRD